MYGHIGKLDVLNVKGLITKQKDHKVRLDIIISLFADVQLIDYRSSNNNLYL